MTLYTTSFFAFFRYNRSFTSDVVNATQNPIWNKKHVFVGVDEEEWASCKLEISVWNFSSKADHKCLGINRPIGHRHSITSYIK